MMNEQSQQEDERENLSGMDDYEAYIYATETDFKAAPRVPVATACQTVSDLEKSF